MCHKYTLIYFFQLYFPHAGIQKSADKLLSFLLKKSLILLSYMQSLSLVCKLINLLHTAFLGMQVHFSYFLHINKEATSVFAILPALLLYPEYTDS